MAHRTGSHNLLSFHNNQNALPGVVEFGLGGWFRAW